MFVSEIVDYGKEKAKLLKGVEKTGIAIDGLIPILGKLDKEDRNDMVNSLFVFLGWKYPRIRKELGTYGMGKD